MDNRSEVKVHCIQTIRTIYNACHDFGKVIKGEFPKWNQVTEANWEGRLYLEDKETHGKLIIKGKNACVVHFKV